jgi:hypothetical protein
MKNVKSPAPVTEQTKLSATDVIKYIIGYSSVVFTAISLILLIVQALTVGEDEIAFVDPSRFLMLYPFTLCTAAAALVFKARTIKMWLKLLIHYGVSAIALYIFVCAPVKNGSIVALASILYLIVALAILIPRAIINKKMNEEIPYQSVFGKANKK